MQFKGYRFTNSDVSYAALHFSNDFENTLTDGIPWWPSTLEEADTEEITSIEYDLIHSENDQILVIGADADDIKDWSFLETLATTSPARCKVLLCNDSSKFSSINHFDAIIQSDQLISESINDLMWALVSALHCGLIGMDEADLFTVVQTSTHGELYTFDLDDSEKSWQDTLQFYQEHGDNLASVKQLTGDFVCITLQPCFNFLECTQDIVDISNQLSPNVARAIGGTVYPQSARYTPKGIIRLAMFR